MCVGQWAGTGGQESGHCPFLYASVYFSSRLTIPDFMGGQGAAWLTDHEGVEGAATDYSHGISGRLGGGS